MPLLDHFRPPLNKRIAWTTIHAGWATRLADQITPLLPDEFTVEELIRTAGRIEIDLAVYDDPDGTTGPAAGGTTAVQPQARAWTPPAAAATMSAVFPETFEVLIYNHSEGKRLVAAVEFVSPSNKDRDSEKRAFAAKVASYLNAGVGVVVIDVVTTRRANLHNATIELMGADAEYALPPRSGQYAVSYQPVIRDKAGEVDMWFETFRVGDVLPTMPLRVWHDITIPLDFEASYMEACRRRKLV